MKTEVRPITASQNGATSLISQYKAVKPRKACRLLSAQFHLQGQAIHILRNRPTYGEGFVQILAKDDSLGLDYEVLDEIMDILQRGIEG